MVEQILGILDLVYDHRCGVEAEEHVRVPDGHRPVRSGGQGNVPEAMLLCDMLAQSGLSHLTRSCDQSHRFESDALLDVLKESLSDVL